jgi:transglutaminase-like putative cysteine protease
LEPRDDPTIEDVAHALRARVAGNDIAFAQYALAFVQGGITYVLDQPGFEYPLYPLETLVDRAGDCEDTTILYVSLLRALQIPVSMAFIDSDGDDLPDHVLALVPIPSVTSVSGDCPPGTVPGIHEISGKLYTIAETAADPLRSGYLPLGCDPWGIGPDAIKEQWNF